MNEHERLAREVGAVLAARGLMCATAESCTGGLVAAAITDIAGSSEWFDRGFVTYTNAAKEAMLGVPAATLAAFGAVSEPVARAMAEGAGSPFHAAFEPADHQTLGDGGTHLIEQGALIGQGSIAEAGDGAAGGM